MNMVRVTVDGKQIQVDSEKSLLIALEENGILIPSLCRNGTANMDTCEDCGLSLVEVNGAKKLFRACEVMPVEKMCIVTQSESIMRGQQAALSILYSNHYRYNCYIMRGAEMK